MNVQSAPVGVFDSGLGGLSVAMQIRRALPGVDVLYAADSRYCPYGGRSASEIADRSLAMIRALVERGARAIVIACNTATSVVLEAARAVWSVPIIGLEPAVKPAVELTATGRIAVIATPRTATSDRLARLIARYATDVDVVVASAPEWVPLVECGTTTGKRAREAVSAVVTPLVERGADVLVLGCTHYPFLRETIEDVAGGVVRVIDSGEAIARRTATVLAEDGDFGSSRDGDLRVLTTGDAESVQPIARRLLREEVVVSHLLVANPSAYAPELVASPKLSDVWTVSTSGRL